MLMSSSLKENEVLTATPESAAQRPAATGARPDETASRPQPVALEVPVTVNGARTVEGSDKREPFSETTKTVLVFGNGAVIRLASPVAAGQLLFLTNDKTKKEVVCQVVKSKNYRNVSGYVELEFTEPVVGFWGMRFPGDRIGPQAPASQTVSPAASRIPETKPAPRPAEVNASVSVTPKPQLPVTQKPVAPVVPISVAPKPSAPVAPPSIGVTSSPRASEIKASAPAAPPVKKQESAPAASDNSSEALKLQAARLQEQLSSMLFSEAPAPKAPQHTSAANPKAISDAAAKIFEISKSDPLPLKTVPPARHLPPPMKSSLDAEEVKIPAWLEPLARNSAAPASTHELVEREKARHAAEMADREAAVAEAAPLPETFSAPEVEEPEYASRPSVEERGVQLSSSGGSKKGLWIGIAAGIVVLLAGGAWYLRHPSGSLQASAAVAPTQTASGASAPFQSPTQGVAATQTNSAANLVTSAPASSASAGPVNPPPVATVREDAKNSAKTVPAAITERVAQPPQTQPKKPSLGQVHLATPTRAGVKQENGDAAPSLSADAMLPNAESLSSGIATSNAKQPMAPEGAMPIGGDVRPAKMISSVQPVYPSLAKSQHVSGDVRLDALIDANGRVTTMKIVSGPTLLQQAAMDSLRQWRYQPATLDGKAVPMHLTVTLQFRLQ